MEYLTHLLYQNIKHTHKDLLRQYLYNKDLLGVRDLDKLSLLHLMTLNPETYKEEIKDILEKSLTTEQRVKVLSQPLKAVEFGNTMCSITMEPLNSINGVLYITEDNQIRYVSDIETFWGLAKNSLNSYLESDYGLGSISEAMLGEEQQEQVATPTRVDSDIITDDDWHTDDDENLTTNILSESQPEPVSELDETDVAWETDSESSVTSINPVLEDRSPAPLEIGINEFISLLAGGNQFETESTPEPQPELGMNELIGMLGERMGVDLTKAQVKCPNTRQAIKAIIPLELLSSEQLKLLSDKDGNFREFINLVGKSQQELTELENLKKQILTTFPRLLTNDINDVIKLKSSIEAIDNEGILTITGDHKSKQSLLTNSSSPLCILAQSAEGLEILSSIFIKYPDILNQLPKNTLTSLESNGSSAIYWLSKSTYNFNFFKLLIKLKPEIIQSLSAEVLTSPINEGNDKGLSILLNLFKYEEGQNLLTGLLWENPILKHNVIKLLFDVLKVNKGYLKHINEGTVNLLLANKEDKSSRNILLLIMHSTNSDLQEIKEIITTDSVSSFSSTLYKPRLITELKLFKYNNSTFAPSTTSDDKDICSEQESYTINTRTMNAI